MDRNQRQGEPPTRDLKSPTVLSIECLKGSSKADEWTGDMLQTGDIVEEIGLGFGRGSSCSYKSPFKNGKSGVQKILHSSFKGKETSILVKVRRGNDEFTELQACIVPESSGKKNQYMLRSIDDPNYAVGFVDRTEAECFELQGESCVVPRFCSFLTFLIDFWTFELCVVLLCTCEYSYFLF